MWSATLVNILNSSAPLVQCLVNWRQIYLLSNCLCMTKTVQMSGRTKPLLNTWSQLTLWIGLYMFPGMLTWCGHESWRAVSDGLGEGRRIDGGFEGIGRQYSLVHTASESRYLNKVVPDQLVQWSFEENMQRCVLTWLVCFLSCCSRETEGVPIVLHQRTDIHLKSSLLFSYPDSMMV